MGTGGLASAHGRVSTDPRHDLGARGEAAAVKALRRAGYKIRDRNYHTRWGEVDVIAEQRGVLAFVEVKTRTTSRHGSPAEAVTPRKQERLHRAAQLYLYEHKLQDRLCRFDIVSIVWPEGARKPEVTILPDAFTPPEDGG